MNFMFNIPEMYEKYSIPRKDIIHIGAWEGCELETYHQMGIPRVLFIEANPKVYTKLIDNIKKASLTNMDVKSICCAISNKVGITAFHVMSSDQSSSILPLKIHSEIYPDIKEVECINVPCYALDNLLVFMKLNPIDFNFINIDIQGAELLAFQGAIDLLANHIVAINTEVNYDELYEDCVLEPVLSKFLLSFGFHKKEETRPYHPSWGDAFYVKE